MRRPFERKNSDCARMSGRGLGVIVMPHLIPAGTLANHDIDRAMEEPLALDRDEVLYMICTHPRLRAVWPNPHDREFDVLIARNAGASDIGWDPEPWAHLTVPEHVRPASVEWAISDSALETVEGLTRNPRAGVDAPAHLQELLGWIFDRHLEEVEPPAVDRGTVEGGQLSFAVEYIGKSDFEALRRATGPHHKLPQILNRTMVFTPHLLAYVFPCELRLVAYSPGETGTMEALPFGEALRTFGLPRETVVSAAEEMLIARLGGAHNVRSTGTGAFPNSASARALVELGFTQAGIAFGGIPPHVELCGKHEQIDNESGSCSWELTAT
jgi:hypothetical protein